MKPTTFRARVEPLEQRETPSTGAGLHHLAPHIAALRGTGTGVLQSQIATATGVERFTTLSGRSTVLGNFTGGALSDFASATAPRGTSTLTLFTQSGDQIGLTATVAFGTPHPKAHTVPVTISFTILDGTGAFVNTSGSGTITGTQNLATGVLKFNLNGRIAVI
jgi:hypothetical protein